ncbi:YraN family protein [Patescibacteria group bacterium]|nr:YraN family protein [Patescibacteria group bacterium]MCL5409583.1 YraN family protein [Patescibacteria group bacterium]
MTTVKVGNFGEELACAYLKKLGWKIIARNYRIRGGEIDIIAQDKNQLVFVEVKFRTTHRFGLPIESITAQKINTLTKTIQFYLAEKNQQHVEYRLDCVSIDLTDKIKPEIELIKNILN